MTSMLCSRIWPFNHCPKKPTKCFKLCLTSTEVLRPGTQFGEYVSGEKTPGFWHLAWSISTNKAFSTLKLLSIVCFPFKLGLNHHRLKQKVDHNPTQTSART